MKKNLLVLLTIFIVILLLIYHHWFSLTTLSSGDWDYLFNTNDSNLYPFIWNKDLGNGLGAQGAYILGLTWYYYASASIFFTIFHLSWVIVERISWFFPFLCIGGYSSYFFWKVTFQKYNNFAPIAQLIFLTNTYILMLVGGGQMGVGMAYALAPLVVGMFVYTYEHIFQRVKPKKIILSSILTGCIVAIQVLFDLRITYVTLFVVFLYSVFLFFQQRKEKKTFLMSSILFLGLIPGIIATLLNAFWLFPFAFLKENPLEQLGSIYSSADAVRFFSFAQFENSLSLLHPNWPENIFGKVFFMRPEFLILPVIAFSIVIFNNYEDKREKQFVIFFSLLGLVGAFLGKGANLPFGEVYIWLFTHFPGFQMFRDPLKWYILVVFSYTVLIPYALIKISLFLNRWINKRYKEYIYIVTISLFILFWLYTIHYSISGNLQGTFTYHSFPKEYEQLQQFLEKQQPFFRTMWVPAVQRYGYKSAVHPAIPAVGLFHVSSTSATVKALSLNANLQLLQDASVKYIIVPDDVQGELFLSDRKYDKNIQYQTAQVLGRIPWFAKIKKIDNIVIFEIAGRKDHFWSPNATQISYQFISPTHYAVSVAKARKGDTVVFSEGYDMHWVAKIGSNLIQSKPYHTYFNSFSLPAEGSYTIDVYYYPQQWVDSGVLVSVISLLSVILSIYILKRKYD